MLQDVFQPQEQLRIEDILSPINAQIYDFCNSDLFSETLQNSEVTSCSYEDIEKFNSYQDIKNVNTNSTPTTTTTTSTTTTTTSNTTATTANNNNNNSNNLSIIFDSQDEIDNDISASIDFSPSPPFSVPPFFSTQQYQFDFSSSSSLQPHHQLSDVVMDGISVSPYPVNIEPVAPLLVGGGPHNHQMPLVPSVFEEDCLSSVPSYVPLNHPSSPSCSFLAPAMSAAYMPMRATLSADSSGIFTLRGSELQPQELEYQGDNVGIYCTDSMQRVFNPGDLQKTLSSDSQQLMSAATSSTPITSEISSLEDSTFKVGKLSVEQRKEKIHRYMKKRNERNFSKKIKYACRKTLADSRPRVRGRFAKNDDFGETHRTTCSNHEEDDDDEVVVKEEEDLVDSSDIFAHISGVNSFECNYSIQSWI